MLMAQEKYPQGMRNKPISVSSPTGNIVKQFNSYREAMDYTDKFDEMRLRSDRDIRPKQNAEDVKAEKEGFPPRKIKTGAGTYIQGADTLGEKSKAMRSEIQSRNMAWMQNSANRKQAYPGQSNVSKLMGVKITKPGK
jgi:hypothetical protein